MRRTTLAFAALLASTVIAQAQSGTVLQTAGWWKAYYYPKNDNGSPMCSMGAGFTDGRAIYVKFEGASVFFHLHKPSWRVPSDASLPIKIQFDRKDPYVGTATGTQKSTMVHAGINVSTYDKLKQFVDEFREADWMTINFPGGSEPQWTADMKGSDVVGDTFWRCLSAVVRDTPAQTQPHNGGGTTQPHGNAKSKSKTQPHGSTTQPTTMPPTQPGRDI